MIITEVRPDQKARVTEPSKKERPSDRHQVVLLQPVNRNIPCTTCLLKLVFRMSDKEAVQHAERARKTGAEPVYVSYAEIAETRARIANETAQRKADSCHPRARQVSFKSEPAP